MQHHPHCIGNEGAYPPLRGPAAQGIFVLLMVQAMIVRVSRTLLHLCTSYTARFMLLFLLLHAIFEYHHKQILHARVHNARVA